MAAITRRDFAGFSALALSAAPLSARVAALRAEAAPFIVRTIPKTRESLPAVGLGTAHVFDNDDEGTRRAAAEVVGALLAGGGRLIDTASSYGDAEGVLGAVMAAAGVQQKLFVATKLEAPDEEELKRSLSRLKLEKLDLLFLHNVSDPRQSMAAFRGWKAQGICRYIGITSTFHGDFPAVEAVLAREKPDFVEIDYSLDEREAEKRILPLAAEVGAGVLTAVPFGRGRLFERVRGHAIPDWAKGFAQNWPQFFLKFLIADERVTAVIPGTSNAAHMADNLGAMRGALPDSRQRKRMVEFLESL